MRIRSGCIRNLTGTALNSGRHLIEKRPQLAQSWGRHLTSARGLNSEGWLSLRQVCEALRTREGRNPGTGAQAKRSALGPKGSPTR